MKLLFNLDVIEGNRVKARPSDYLRSLPEQQQITEVGEFLQWAGNAAEHDPDPQVRAEAAIGVATAREFLDKLQDAAPRIYTGDTDRHE